LVGVLLISALASLLQARAAAVIGVLGRVEDTHRLTLAELSVDARIRTSWVGFRAMGRRADGSPVVFRRDGWDWEVRVTDVEGLVDLYSSSPGVLGLLPGQNAAVMLDRRRSAFASLPIGDRWITEEQTLARFGFGAEERERLAPLVTQRARTGAINPDLAPPELVNGARTIAEQDNAGGELAEISIRRLQ
jgi:hypothetical protein